MVVEIALVLCLVAFVYLLGRRHGRDDARLEGSTVRLAKQGHGMHPSHPAQRQEATSSSAPIQSRVDQEFERLRRLRRRWLWLFVVTAIVAASLYATLGPSRLGPVSLIIVLVFLVVIGGACDAGKAIDDLRDRVIQGEVGGATETPAKGPLRRK